MTAECYAARSNITAEQMAATTSHFSKTQKLWLLRWQFIKCDSMVYKLIPFIFFLGMLLLKIARATSADDKREKERKKTPLLFAAR